MSAKVSIERIADDTAGGVWRPSVTLLDLVYPVYLPGLALVSVLLPEAAWPALCRLIALPSRFSRRRPRRVALIEGMLAGRSEVAAEDVASELSAGYHESRMQCLRHYLGWRPQVRLDGAEHLDAALARGRGAILWTENFAFSALVSKMALHRAGYAIHHLSRPSHGFTHSLHGAPLFNRIWTSVERRYLAERIVIRGDHAGAAVTALMHRLRANKAVSITVTTQAQQIVSAPFLNGYVRLAAGPAKLAARTGAALLPVFTVRAAPGRYVTTIGPPLAPADPESMAAAYASQLESYVERHPGQYRGW